MSSILFVYIPQERWFKNIRKTLGNRHTLMFYSHFTNLFDKLHNHLTFTRRTAHIILSDRRTNRREICCITYYVYNHSIVYLICIHTFDVNLVGQPILFCFNDIITSAYSVRSNTWVAVIHSKSVIWIRKTKASLKYDVKGVEWEYICI